MLGAQSPQPSVIGGYPADERVFVLVGERDTRHVRVAADAATDHREFGHSRGQLATRDAMRIAARRSNKPKRERVDEYYRVPNTRGK
jgi:hypothetical protein